MKKLEISKKKAGDITTIVGGTIAKPTIYLGKRFRPGDEVKVVKVDNLSTIKKEMIRVREHIYKLCKDWDEWFTTLYKNTPEDMTPASKDILFWQLKIFPQWPPIESIWDNPYLQVLYVKEKLAHLLKSWKVSTQIATIYDMIPTPYPWNKSREETIQMLIQCYEELEEKNKGLKEFIQDIINDREKEYLKPQKLIGKKKLACGMSIATIFIW